MNTFHKALLLALWMTVSQSASSQALSLADAQARGAKLLTAEEVKQVVSGASVEFKLVNGSTRRWTNEPDGSFIASRVTDSAGKRNTARGMWSVNEDGAYCLTFDWGASETDSSCRLLYRIDEHYVAYRVGAKPGTLSGRFDFSK